MINILHFAVHACVKAESRITGKLEEWVIMTMIVIKND